VKLRRTIVFFIVLLFIQGCLIPGQQKPKKDPEREMFKEIMIAFNNRAYESTINTSRQFLSQYPESPGKDPVLMRMGESFDGLLHQHYQSLIDEGMDEAAARSSFLERYGHYDCWEERSGSLVYNKEIYRRLLEENPDSNYADEAAYNLIIFEQEYVEDPDRIRAEITSLEKVITKYPTTSLRPKIMFQMGYRFHLLHDLYSFSENPKKRDSDKAQENFQQAEYIYKLCLNLPHGAEYSKKALRYLEMLRQGTRIDVNAKP
jgi:outer membrane protein assembly factor BamD (BamD/ComL family)